MTNMTSMARFLSYGRQSRVVSCRLNASPLLSSPLLSSHSVSSPLVCVLFPCVHVSSLTPLQNPPPKLTLAHGGKMLPRGLRGSPLHPGLLHHRGPLLQELPSDQKNDAVLGHRRRSPPRISRPPRLHDRRLRRAPDRVRRAGHPGLRELGPPALPRRFRPVRQARRAEGRSHHQGGASGRARHLLRQRRIVVSRDAEGHGRRYDCAGLGGGSRRRPQDIGAGRSRQRQHRSADSVRVGGPDKGRGEKVHRCGGRTGETSAESGAWRHAGHP
mmetsp:Transcript_34599/g.79990  ORF Transcript_34599/g.79990 Transcript_34599/m.79990 type:complete len:272 (-) Transcript_34599:185-1000(-)